MEHARQALQPGKQRVIWSGIIHLVGEWARGKGSQANQVCMEKRPFKLLQA